MQAAFVDKHLRNVSDRFDFDSFRVGIQPFSSDFRGFLFQDNQLGVRLFGTRDNNRWQYNLAYFRRIEKDTNSGLNDLGRDACATTTCSSRTSTGRTSRCVGFTSQADACSTTAIARATTRTTTTTASSSGRRRSGCEAPRDYDVIYLGYNGDGHFGR